MDWQVQITSRTQRRLHLEREEGLVSRKRQRKHPKSILIQDFYYVTEGTSINNFLKQPTNATVPTQMTTMERPYSASYLPEKNITFNYPLRGIHTLILPWIQVVKCWLSVNTLGINQIWKTSPPALKGMNWHTVWNSSALSCIICEELTSRRSHSESWPH